MTAALVVGGIFAALLCLALFAVTHDYECRCHWCRRGGRGEARVADRAMRQVADTRAAPPRATEGGE